MKQINHNPTALEGEERFIQAQDQYMLPPHVHTPMNDTRTRDITRNDVIDKCSSWFADLTFD